MKRSRVPSSSDDHVPERKVPTPDHQLHHNHLSALDVHNFPVNWPIWRQQFQIHLTANHDNEQMTVRKKLAIFLNCLGKNGIALATAFFPQLNDFDSAAAKKVTLDMICSRFNDHCTSARDAKSEEDAFLASHKFFKAPVKDDHGIVDCYAKILSAAEKCEFKCAVCQTSYTERIARDQLLAAVSDEYLVPKLLNLGNPSSQEIIAMHEEIKRDQKIWTEILKYLSLCDVDAVAQMSPRMKLIVDKHVEGGSHGLQIEPCCLLKRPIQANKKFYEKYKSRNTSLKLISIAGPDVDSVLWFYYPRLTRLTLSDVQIFHDISAFPEHLTQLTIRNSAVEGRLLREWLKNNRKTLLLLSMEHVEHYFPLIGQVGGLSDKLIIDDVENLRRLTIRGEYVNLLLDSTLKNLSYIHIQAKRSVDISIKCPNIVDLILDVPNARKVAMKIDSFNAIRHLTLAGWTSSSQYLTKWRKLESLTILCPVDVKYKKEVQKLNIATVLATYNKAQSPKREDQPGLIFEMLNDDCLLEIIGYLAKRDWITFGRLHSKSAWIVINFKYPRANLTGNDFRDSTTVAAQSFREICPYVRSMTVDKGWTRDLLGDFTELKSLTLQDILVTDENIDRLPVGLEKLHLLYPPVDFDEEEEDDSEDNDEDSEDGEEINYLTEYFKRLSSTLRVLEVGKLSRKTGQALMKFRGLQELKVGDNISADSVANILKQNPGLRRVDLNLRCMSKKLWVALGKLKNISNLSIDGGCPIVEGYYSNVLGLLQKVGPKLVNLSIPIWRAEESNMLRCCQGLENLKELKVVVRIGVQKTIDNICLLKGLQKLQITTFMNPDDVEDVEDTEEYDFGQFIGEEEEVVTARDVLLLVKELPKLREIQSKIVECFPIKLGLELQRFLRENNRNLRINSVDL